MHTVHQKAKSSSLLMVVFLHKPRSIAISLSLSSLKVKLNGMVLQYFEQTRIVLQYFETLTVVHCCIHVYEKISLKRVSSKHACSKIFIHVLILYVKQ
jgi:hypothetical protein